MGDLKARLQVVRVRRCPDETSRALAQQGIRIEGTQVLAIDSSRLPFDTETHLDTRHHGADLSARPEAQLRLVVELGISEIGREQEGSRATLIHDPKADVRSQMSGAATIEVTAHARLCDLSSPLVEIKSGVAFARVSQQGIRRERTSVFILHSTSGEPGTDRVGWTPGSIVGER